MSSTERNPMQPLYFHPEQKRVRFKPNALVQHLLDNGGLDMNDLAMVECSQDDHEQFAQLIGYSLKGFHELSYVSDLTALEASTKARDLGLEGADQGCRADGCEIHCGVERE